MKEKTRPILVTGATGFLGGHLVRRLLADGQAVRATGRNLRAGLALQRQGADFRPVDLRDRAATVASCEGVTAVVHAGALSSAWGRREDFFDINVRGTEHVLGGCLRHGVQRLVYISSPSIQSRFAPQLGLTEESPLPARFVSPYAETKKLAEDLVRDAQQKGLETVILRPKAIYGPGDRAIFPRLIEAASRGWLPRIGDGDTVTNLTHVTDAVQAVLLALARPEAAGRTFLITGGQDVRLWDVIDDLLARLGLPAPRRRLSVAQAMAVGAAMEAAWTRLRLPGEPPLTRYKVGVLACSQTYDISAARRELGYAPRVSVKDGIDDLVRRFGVPEEPITAPLRRPARGRPARVRCTVLAAGRCRVPERLFLPTGGLRRIDVPALFALLEHPREGAVLFDTGYAPRFFAGTRRFPERAYRYLTPVVVAEEEAAAAQLARRGIAPRDVSWIILSHFDPDHVGGLPDFPKARVACSFRAWEAVRGKTGVEALRVRLLPGHLPEDLSARLYLLPDPEGEGVGPFEHAHDLFDDGSIRLVALPGHAAGQVGAFVRAETGEFFLAADGCWNLASLAGPTIRAGIHRRMAVDPAGQEDTYRRLQRLLVEYPEIAVVPAHCPEAAARFVEAGAKT